MDHELETINLGPEVDLIVSIAFAVILGLIKNPAKVARLKSVLRKLRDELLKLPLDE